MTSKRIVWELHIKKYQLFFFFVHLLVGLLLMPGYWLFQVNSGWFLLYQYKILFLQFSISHPFDVFLKTFAFVIEHDLISPREFC